MANFIQEAIQELEHVVWPTSKESKKYMIYTVGTIFIMASILAVLGYGLRQGLTGVRNQLPHTTPVISGEEDVVSSAELEAALAKRRQLNNSGTSASGAKLNPATASGTTNGSGR